MLFAIKHEGINLQVLAQALAKVPQPDVQGCVTAHPNSVTVRKMAYLWEAFSGKTVQAPPVIRGYVGLFDPKRYFTAPGPRCKKWHIEFNGLGSLAWCATVERTVRLQNTGAQSFLARCEAWFDQIGALNADRAVSWAYLNETRGSFALERESVSENKALRFVKLLQRAQEIRELTEDCLCELQSVIVSNPFRQAFSWRNEQNWLSRGGSGSYAVTYVPPPPEALADLMQGWMAAANRLYRQTDPLVAAAVISFGFVFLHPFMDGNGRLSRFLVHQQLALSKGVKPGRLLPISVAMKQHEEQYLQALTQFSRPMREAWEVLYTGGNPEYECRFSGDISLYRYWDATAQTEFLFDMSEEALSEHLADEVEYLKKFDLLGQAVNDAFDMAQADRHALVRSFLDQGRVTKNFRKKFALRIEGEAMDWLENNAAALLQGKN